MTSAPQWVGEANTKGEPGIPMQGILGRERNGTGMVCHGICETNLAR